MREGRFQLGLEIAAGNVGNLNFPHSLLCAFINYISCSERYWGVKGNNM